MSETNQEVSFKLTPHALRLIKVYGLLTEDKSGISEDLGGVVSTTLEKELGRRITAILGTKSNTVVDTTGISDGLGDEAPPDEEEQPDPEPPEGDTNPEAQVPGNVPTITDQDLEQDLEVENAAVEAKAEAPPDTGPAEADDLFAGVSGLPVPKAPSRRRSQPQPEYEEESTPAPVRKEKKPAVFGTSSTGGYVDPRIAKRNKRHKGKGKATTMHYAASENTP